ncbi:MAG: DUF2526 family protein [Morganella sp. (in: enterobacteria)]|uniref:DUF2526 family protein n=1 Tax=Morganella psychrotolerans TaxID=368603 RepID=A0A1B8H0G7_9GAMM|nr:DUF2526 family protein [Morganella psychrotolerans]OBU02569.1 hypothetical protein AYY17_13045 [Morganella psychrotolerans]OBU07586.1 hypothetical protein AYY18_04990 [Morganella psychrotolerans]
MSDYAQSEAAVEKAIESNSITEMNKLMISLGDTNPLPYEQRYELQQRLRQAIMDHGKVHH